MYVWRKNPTWKIKTVSFFKKHDLNQCEMIHTRQIEIGGGGLT